MCLSRPGSVAHSLPQKEQWGILRNVSCLQINVFFLYKCRTCFFFSYCFLFIFVLLFSFYTSAWRSGISPPLCSESASLTLRFKLLQSLVSCSRRRSLFVLFNTSAWQIGIRFQVHILCFDIQAVAATPFCSLGFEEQAVAITMLLQSRSWCMWLSHFFFLYNHPHLDHHSFVTAPSTPSKKWPRRKILSPVPVLPQNLAVKER